MAQNNITDCPQCNKTIYIQREAGGWYEVCVACGYRNDISGKVSLNTVGQAKVVKAADVKQVCDINLN